MSQIRPSAVAGLYYPSRATELEQILSQQLAPATGTQSSSARALIVPHSGYFYSGQVAAKAYSSLAALADEIDRVVLIGPSHKVDFEGVSIAESDFFATPLGNVAIAKNILPKLSQIRGVALSDYPHQDEHSLEVQLPFLQYSLNQFDIVPILTGKTCPSLIADVIGTATQDSRSLIVISSDLSHYLDYETALKVDQFTSQAIINLDNHELDEAHACGSVAISGFLEYARTEHWTGKVMSLRNSGDVAGKKDSVVGYGAYLFECA